MGDTKSMIKLDIGCGRMKEADHVGIDITQIIDGKGNAVVDYIVDMEKDLLPFEPSTVDEIKVTDFLEHITNLKHCLNECWRVLKQQGILHGHVPICNTLSHWKDPTHKRCFIKETFTYFSGKSGWKQGAPAHPKYADYGLKCWIMHELGEYHSQNGVNQLIKFRMSPNK